MKKYYGEVYAQTSNMKNKAAQNYYPNLLFGVLYYTPCRAVDNNFYGLHTSFVAVSRKNAITTCRLNIVKTVSQYTIDRKTPARKNKRN